MGLIFSLNSPLLQLGISAYVFQPDSSLLGVEIFVFKVKKE